MDASTPVHDPRCPEVRLVGMQYAHMGRHSGYNCLMDYVGSPLTVPMRRWGKGRINAALTTALSKAAGMPWYSPGAFALELRTALAMSRSRGRSLYHVLQAESDLWLSTIAGSLTSDRVLGTIHQPLGEIERAGGPWKSWSKLATVVAVSTSQVDYLTSALPDVPVVFVPHGVDVRFFTPPAPCAEHRLLHDPLRILTVGRHLRDFAVLERSVVQLRERLGACEFTVVNPPEPVRARLTELGASCRYGMSDESLRDLYRDSDLMLLPLSDSTANNALLEAMASGLPTVVSAVGGVPEYCPSGEAALVPIGEPEAMVEAAVRVLGTRAIYTALARRARGRAEELCWENIATRMKEVYANVNAR
jgi:glycosyltransferase involved in cell wall biosynthesis